MAILFKPDNHQYISTDESDIAWISVTSLLGHFKQAFDAVHQASKSSRNKKSKWYGMSPDDIQKVWKAESTRAIKLGSWYHDQQEKAICNVSSIIEDGRELSVVVPQYDNYGNKIAPDQKVTDGIYPEHLVYLKSAGVCGQSDLVKVIDGAVHICDYKTNKEIKKEGYTNWEGITQKMHFPVSHLDDCNLNLYNLQLSVYLYIILKHNPRLRPGSLTIHHILFEETGADEYGYPVTRLDEKGDPVVKTVVPYAVPYLRDEVISIMHWLHENKEKLNKKR